MRYIHNRKVRRYGSDDSKVEECILWIDELPPNLIRGKNQLWKSRRGKRLQNEQIIESLLENQKDYW